MQMLYSHQTTIQAGIWIIYHERMTDWVELSVLRASLSRLIVLVVIRANIEPSESQSVCRHKTRPKDK